MIEFCYTACIVNANDDDYPQAEGASGKYAVVSVFRGCVGFRLPSMKELYFAKYEDASAKAHEMNNELGIDSKEAAYLAIEAFRKTY